MVLLQNYLKKRRKKLFQNRKKIKRNNIILMGSQSLLKNINLENLICKSSRLIVKYNLLGYSKQEIAVLKKRLEFNKIGNIVYI